MFCLFEVNIFALYEICLCRFCSRGLYNVCLVLFFSHFFQELTGNFSFLQDEEGVISTFSVLGQTHPTYTECITQELLQEVGSLKHFLLFCCKKIR